MNRRVDAAAAVGQPAPAVGSRQPHESAALHVSGRAPYTDDLPELAGTLHCALGLSPLAHGVLQGIDIEALRALPGVVAVLTAKDVPGENECGSLVKDDPILAGEAGATLRWLGQPVFAMGAPVRGRDGQVLGVGHNRPVGHHDPSAHAEIEALRAAALAVEFSASKKPPSSRASSGWHRSAE